MKYIKIFSGILALITSLAANASHCKYLSSKYASKVFEDLANYQKTADMPILDRYCEACQDPYVKPIVIEDLEYRPYQVKGYASIAINGEELDLAYLYLNGKNLGFTYNCKTQIADEYLFTQKLSE